jgi:adenine C2-methylase RlmN of 23S rRNA A2503 and tRNA A37
MRVQQLWHWIYVRGAQDFSQMTSVSKELHAVLDAHYTLARPEVVAEQISVDGTRKWLLRLPGEHEGERPHEVECVYIPESDRGTLCVSSQVGCTLTCSFCHTGTQRLGPQPDARARSSARSWWRATGSATTPAWSAPKAPACRPAATAASPTS